MDSYLYLRRVIWTFLLLIAVACLIVLPTWEASSSDTLSSDTLETDQGPLTITPIEHATFALQWNGKTILVDPVGGAEPFKPFSEPDLVLITDIHPDHLNPETLEAVVKDKAQIVAPAAVNEKLSKDLQKKTTIVANGETQEAQGIRLETVPMYNITEDRLKYHEKGRGNGYVLTMGDKRVYISGDTEDIPEMRELKNIDAAFLCMNLPYTMTVEQAADAVREFKPKIVYPYHYRNSDVDKFKELVGDDAGVEVRLLRWYPEKAK